MKVDSQSVLGRFLAGPFESKNKRVSITLCNAPLFFFTLTALWSMHFIGSILCEVFKIGDKVFRWYFDLKPGTELNSLVPRGSTYIFLDEIRVTPAFWSILCVYFVGGIAFLKGDYSSWNAVFVSVTTMPGMWCFPAAVYAISTAVALIIGGAFSVFMTAVAILIGIAWWLFKLWEYLGPLRRKASASTLVLSEKTANLRRSICHRFSINIDLK